MSAASHELLWLDFEFTGLDVETDRITEVGVIVTDFSLRELETYHSFAYTEESILRELFDRNPWWNDRQDQKEAMIAAATNEGQRLGIINEALTGIASAMHRKPVLLAGNSIYNDRKWIDRYMPELASHLNYRMLDVSSFKVLAEGLMDVHFEKNEAHRSIDDIRESIGELKFLLPQLTTIDFPSIFAEEINT